MSRKGVVSTETPRTSVLKYLNADLIGVITQRDASITSGLMMTCRTLLKLVKSHYNKKHCKLVNTDITLKFTQCLLRDTFRSMMNETMIFKARKSFGKTIAGYAAIGKCGLVLTTSEVFKVWVTEAKNLGWYNSDPAVSRVLCYSGVKKHKDYIDKVLASKGTLKPRKNVILIVKDTNVYTGVEFMGLVESAEPKALVIDEAHVKRCAVSNAQMYCKWNSAFGVFDRQLMLSADEMNPDKLGISGAYRKVSVNDLGKVPTISWNIELTMRTLFNDLVKILNTHERVVMVGTVHELDSVLYYGIPPLPDGTDKKIKRAKNKYFRGAKIFYQKTGIDTITKYNEYGGDCILLMNTIQNKGVNVHADALFIHNAGTTNSLRITQTVGRIVRTTNMVDVVEIYLMCNSELSFIRCHYARCFYTETWEFAFNTLPEPQFLRKCVSIMKLFGTSIVEVDAVDGCIIFSDSLLIDDVFAVLDWWQANSTNETVLSYNAVSDLLCI